MPADVEARAARLRPFINRHLAHLELLREAGKHDIVIPDAHSVEPIQVAPVEDIYGCE
jgi:hypothetical protein